jgi:hypothetical protein
VRIPLEAYSANLTDFQFRLLATVCHLATSEGRLETTAGSLGIASGNVTEKTVRRGLAALEQAGFVRRTKTKRANGYRGKDILDITSPQVTSGPVEAQEIWASNVRTSHDYKSHSSITNKPLVPNSKDSNKLKDIESKGILMKEIRVPMRKWEDDGEDLAGFGLVEPKDAAQPKVRKSDPRTRGKRPEHEWTPMDVAAEFSFQVGRKYPLLPGTVSVKSLSGALAKFRKQYNTTALIELELLRLFMADENNFRNIGDEAPFLYKMFLASFGKKMNQARENLGLGKVNAPIETVVKIGTLVASDGRVFQNSLSGRAQLDRYEKKLKENVNG